MPSPTTQWKAQQFQVSPSHTVRIYSVPKVINDLHVQQAAIAFGGGYTIYNTKGGWSVGGTVNTEKSSVLEVVVPDMPGFGTSVQAFLQLVQDIAKTHGEQYLLGSITNDYSIVIKLAE